MKSTKDSPKNPLSQKRSAWQLGEPGGALWLLKWLVLLALVVLLILALIPSDTGLADAAGEPGRDPSLATPVTAAASA